MAEPETTDEDVRALADALVSGDPARCTRQIEDALERGIGATTILADLIPGAFERIQAAQTQAESGIADEHCASCLTPTIIHELAHRVEPAPWSVVSGQPACVVVCVEGERHDLGAHVLTVFLRRHGWIVLELGQDTPLPELIKYLTRRNVEAILLCASTRAALGHLNEALVSLRASPASRACAIVAGGLATRDVAEHLIRFGADLVTSDPREACGYLSRWIEGRRAAGPGAPRASAGPARRSP